MLCEARSGDQGYRRLRAPRSVLLIVIVVLGALTAGCASTDEETSSEAASSQDRVCEVFDGIDWNADPVTADDSTEVVEAKFDQDRHDEQAMAESATNSLGATAKRVLEAGDRYRTEFLEQRREAGGGDQLSQEAQAAGFFTSRQYVESLVFEDVKSVRSDRRMLSSSLGAVCDGITPPDAEPLSTDEAPTGEILAVKLRTNEIHRFSTDGTELGKLELPGVQAPIFDVTVSPDGRRLAFNAGTDDPRMWVVELESGVTSSSTATTCMDWASDNVELWAWVDTPPNDFVARVSTDGTFDSSSELDTTGCPYRFTEKALAMVREPVDGALPQVELVPTDGDPAQPLISSRCSLVAPRFSESADKFVVTAGCSTDAESGVYTASPTGKNLNKVFSGVAAAATWSPDGNWITFGAYSPGSPGDEDQTRVLIMSTDADLIAPVTPPGYSWPIWVNQDSTD